MSSLTTHTDASVLREQVLVRQLTAGQQAMMALGGAIGTGLFLGSALAVNVAGPAAVVSYLIAAGTALLLGVALTEMAVAHPTAGSFGLYAGMYISPFAGYAVRVSYWLMQVIATGGHMVAIATYMHFWFPGVPGAWWIVAFSLALVYLNTRSVGSFGQFEYWFAMIKVVAIAVFVVLGTALLFGKTGPGVSNYVAHGGFFPRGTLSIWLGVCFAIYSFIGVEIVGVTSGEATDPKRTIPRAMLRMVSSLCLIYITTMLILVGIRPWNALTAHESPFVTVLNQSGVPSAASIMNFIVLSAALSGANANLYLITRTLFSLARAGFAPAALGNLTKRGAPVNALLLSSLGLALAVVVQARWENSAYVWFFGVALFGALFVWLMIFLTHLAFRRARSRDAAFSSRGAGIMSAVGALLIGGMLVTTWWVPGLRPTLLAGGPWLALLAVGYRVSRQR
jgi:L-asparagine transporter-like permease